jgi:hypothetical protein
MQSFVAPRRGHAHEPEDAIGGSPAEADATEAGAGTQVCDTAHDRHDNAALPHTDTTSAASLYSSPSSLDKLTPCRSASPLPSGASRPVQPLHLVRDGVIGPQNGQLVAP